MSKNLFTLIKVVCSFPAAAVTNGRSSFQTDWGFEAWAATMDVRLPGRLKASEPKANFLLLKSAADLWLPLIKRNSSILSMSQSQSTPTFLIIKSAVDFIKRKRVQGRTLTKCRKQIPRLVEASLGRHQKQYTSPKAPTRQQLSPWTSPIPNRNWKRVVEMASSLEGERS